MASGVLWCAHGGVARARARVVFDSALRSMEDDLGCRGSAPGNYLFGCKRKSWCMSCECLDSLMRAGYAVACAVSQTVCDLCFTVAEKRGGRARARQREVRAFDESREVESALARLLLACGSSESEAVEAVEDRRSRRDRALVTALQEMSLRLVIASLERSVLEQHEAPFCAASGRRATSPSLKEL